MLFKVRSFANPTGITGDDYAQRVQEQEIPYLQQLQSQGVITHAWLLVGQDGWLAIMDVQSHEQLLGVIYSNPLSAHSLYDVAPAFDGTTFQGFQS